MSGAIDAPVIKHLALLSYLKLLVDEGVICWGSFLLLAHLPLGGSQPLLLQDEYVPVCTQRYRNGAEMLHENWR